MRISIVGSRELQATVLALKTLDRYVRKEIRTQTKNMAAPEWSQRLNENSNTPLEFAVLAKTGRVRVSDQNVTLSSATVGRKLSGGLDPKVHTAAVEFGAKPKLTTYQARSRRGRTFTVRRNTRAQLRPRKKSGYVVYQAAADMMPRLASLWIQTTARTLFDTLEGRNR